MSGKFTLSAGPDTDAWRKPPSTNIFNAPTKSILSGSPKPLKSFQSACITFTAPWTTLYDQGGLLLHLTNPSNPDRTSAAGVDHWLKTGIEWYQERAWISTVGADNYADWSIFPVPKEDEKKKVTIEVRREGTGLWVYQIIKGTEEVRQPLREVAWFFAKEDEGWVIDVKAMAARPAKEDKVAGEKELVVEFEDAQVVFSE
ncbi:hypothetical protein PM082_006490 [Marasmius tenuissimus]|nr:hypothetical protein PM082_006490 [Marasmius tenuissimus]